MSCTWDETDPTRTQLAEKILQMKNGADNLNDDELQMFLASSSEDENSSNDGNIDNKEKEDNSSDDNGLFILNFLYVFYQ